MHLAKGTILLVVAICGLVLGGAVYWAATGSPSPICGGCYNYNALGCPVIPCPNREGLNMDSFQVDSPTNLTLNIRNTGSAAIILVAYTVKDMGGFQYSKTSWTGPTLNPNQVVATNFVIDGSTFTFQSHSSYYVTVTSTRNNLFTFTIIS